MKPARLLYRLHQLSRSVFVKSTYEELDTVQQLLNPDEWELFIRLQPGEQAHALAMYHKLVEKGETQPDLLLAALLHDVGKLRYPLIPLQRVMVVVVQALFPALAVRWGRLPRDERTGSPVWKKAFVVAGQHAGWGAEMARLAGASPLTVQLIRSHHQSAGPNESMVESKLQHALWMVDNES